MLKVGLSALALGLAEPGALARSSGDEPASAQPPAAAKPSPAPLTREVQQAIQADPQLKGRDISASATKDGTVTLTGVVETQAQKERAARIADRVQGVSTVDNRLAVSSAGGVNLPAAARQAARETGQEISDDWITAKVTSQLLMTGSTVHVTTAGNVVTLGGSVTTDAERQKAIDVARTTSGVARVVDRIKVEPK
jgi:hyperosmotically inducible protein